MTELYASALEYIRSTAKIPSFSSYEERLHPYIRKIALTTPGVRQVEMPGNNLVFTVPGRRQASPVALAAHIDKIDHYGDPDMKEIPFKMEAGQLEGAMDDSAGVGIVMALMRHSARFNFPPLYIFLSEMEESYGLKHHPERLKRKGEGREHGMGARQISQSCIANNMIPSLVITVDTTPLFKGKTGMAVYAKHWEHFDEEPEERLRTETRRIVELMRQHDPTLYETNNTNDYLNYGHEFNTKSRSVVPSLAVEPAIYPYHQAGERVYLSDIRRSLQLLSAFLEHYEAPPAH